VQEIKVRGVVAANGGHHGFVCAVVDGIAEASFLAFELIFEFADWTTEIDDFGVVSLPGELWRGAVRAIEIVFTPEFRDDSRPL